MKLGTVVMILIGTGMTWTAAARGESSPYEPTRARSSVADPAAKVKDPTASWRRVALKTDRRAACPAISGWAQIPLAPKYVKVKDPLFHRAGLDRFCEYQYFGSGRPPAFPADAGLKTSTADRMVVSPASPSPDLDQPAMKTLAGQFLSQAGKGGVDLPASHPAKVRLVFLDTQATGEGVPAAPSGTSAHGFTLAHLAQQLLCARSADCGVELATRLATPLPHLWPSAPPESGTFGLLSDLADAVTKEVGDWRARSQPKPSHLILNISLGWDGEMYGGFDAEGAKGLDLPAQLVYAALRLAKLNGVLVIASAGNRRGGKSEPRWPLLPAAWEVRPLAGSSSPLEHLFGPRLVYAVGGVESQGLPIANSREHGMPRRVAYADHAVAEVGAPAPGSWTSMYTGTSVSAAVTSAIAAAVWTLRPDFSPRELMHRLDDSGDRLEIPADFSPRRTIWPWNQGRVPRARRLSLCRAVTYACRDSSACPVLPTCPAWDPRPPHLSPGGGDLLSLKPDGESYIARYMNAGNEPLIAPQPEDDPCPRCSLKPPSQTLALQSSPAALRSLPAPGSSNSPRLVIDIVIDPTWQAPLGANSTLELTCYQGATPTRRTYLLDVVDGSHTLSFAGLDRASLAGCVASLSFKLKDEDRAVESPIFFDP